MSKYRNFLREKLRNHQPTVGVWVTLESPNVTEAAVELGVDWVVIDLEHGHLDFGDVIEHLRVVRGTTTAAIVRVPEVQQGTMKRALDLGANGLILPMIGSGAELDRAFQFGRYPPRGVRGVGGERAVRWGLEFEGYLRSADEETLLIPLLETRAAVENIDAILAVPGVEAVFFGPADLSASYGYLSQWEGPGIAQIILDLRARAAARGIAAGVMSRNPEDARLRRQQGFEMIGLGADVNLMIRAVREAMAAVK